MSVTAPRCHLCLGLKTPATASGLLVCDHCDVECRASKEKRDCRQCNQGSKSEGRGPRTGQAS